MRLMYSAASTAACASVASSGTVLAPQCCSSLLAPRISGFNVCSNGSFRGYFSSLRTPNKASSPLRSVVTRVIPFERHSVGDTPPPDLASFLFDHRIIYLGLPITSVVTTLIFAEFLRLNSDDRYKDPIYFYINSTGTTKGAYKLGFESEAFTLYDLMGHIVSTICTLAIGVAWGEAALLLAAGRKNKRGALRSASIMLRQPLGQVTGQATQIDAERMNLRDMKRILIKLLSRHTCHSKERIEEDMNHGKYFSPEEAIDYGLIDKIIRSKKRTDQLIGAYDPVEEEDFVF